MQKSNIARFMRVMGADFSTSSAPTLSERLWLC